MKFEELGLGAQDRVARAACAIVAKRCDTDPVVLGRAVAIALAKHGFPGGGPGRWMRYARACQRSEERQTNRGWSRYPRIEQRLASRLAKEVTSIL